MFTSLNWKNILERAIWTFIQGFAVVLVAAPTWDISVLHAGALAGGMAVLSLVKTIAQEALSDGS